MLSEACPAHLGETFFHAYDYNGNTLTKVTRDLPPSSAHGIIRHSNRLTA